MKRSLKRIALALLAILTPCFAWAANPTPVLLLDFGVTTTMADGATTNPDGWKTLVTATDKNSANSSTEHAVTGKDGKSYTVTHVFSGGGKVFNNSTVEDISFLSAPTNAFYNPNKSLIYESALAEMKATLGLTADIPEGVYKDGTYTGQGGANTQTVTISGLTPTQCYTLYYIGFNNQDNSVPNFNLTAYAGDAPIVSYAKNEDSTYSTGTIGTAISGAAGKAMIVRVHNVYPNEDGEFTVVVHSVKSPVSAIAIAETEYVEPLTYSTWTPENASSTLANAGCWSNDTIPTSGNIIIDTSALANNIAVQIPTGFDEVKVQAHASYYTKISLAEGATFDSLVATGRVSMPPALLKDSKVDVSGVTMLMVDTYFSDAITRDLACNITTLNTADAPASATISGVISGNNSITVANKTTLKLTAANTRTGNVTVNTGGTLDLSDANARLGWSDWNRSTVTINGELLTRGWAYGATNALGQLAANTEYVVIDNGTVEFTDDSEGCRGFTIRNVATFIVPEGKKFTYQDDTGIYSDSMKIVNNGTWNLTGKGTYTITSNYDIANTTTVGEGTTLVASTAEFANLTLANGAIIDASAGALTVSGDVTAEGTVSVTLPDGAAAGTEVLACANAATLDLTKLSDAPTGLKWVAENGVIKLATTAVVAGPYGSDTYASLQAAIDYYVENHENGNWPLTDFTFSVLAPINEEVELPSGYSFTLTNLDEFDITGLTVKDENGNVISLEGGKYSNIPYIATVTVGETSTKCADMDAVLAAIATDNVTEATVTLHTSTPIELESTWVITKTIVLDLATETLNAAFTYTATNPAAIWVKNGGKLTLKNGTLSSAAEGVRLGEKGATDTSKAGELVIESNASIITTDIGVMIYGGSTLTSDGTINASGTNATAIQGNGLETVPTSITIPSGTVMSANDHAIYHPQPGTLTIGKEGGQMAPYIQGVTGIEMRAGEVEMLSGTIFATGSYAVAANGSGSTVTGAALAISQHTTDAAAEGIKVTVAAGGLSGAMSLAVVNTTEASAVPVTGEIVGTALDYGYTITVPTVALEGDAETGYTLKTVVAAIGEDKYETLAAAIAAAEEGTITLLKNIEAPGLKITKPVTIDFGGYTYTIVSPGVGSGDKTSNGIQIVQSAKAVTLKNGTIQIAEANKADFYILIQNYADLTLIDMTLDGTNLDKWIAQYGDSYTLSVNSGTVSLEGTTTIKANNDGDKSYAFDSHDYAEMGYDAPMVIVGEDVTIDGKVEVTGGTLDNKGEELDVVISSGTVEGDVTVDTTKSTYLVEVKGVYCDDVEIEAKDGESADDAKARARAALELFTGIATGEVDGTTAKVAYDFGISDIKVDRNENGSLAETVTITAKVQTGDATAAGYAEGVTVTICVDGTALENVPTTVANGVATFEDVKISDLQGKIKVKVSNK